MCCLGLSRRAFMTLKELNQLYYLSVEIAHLKKEIEKR
nr:MAG TPA: Oligomerization domain of C4b-binding protein alpha [Caudoviricetes sp.]